MQDRNMLSNYVMDQVTELTPSPAILCQIRENFKPNLKNPSAIYFFKNIDYILFSYQSLTFGVNMVKK